MPRPPPPEPGLEEILAAPEVRALMRCDGETAAQIMALLRRVAARRRAPEAGDAT